jgi:gliding motility-associated-like protein
VLVKSDLSKSQANFFVPNAFTPNQDGLNDCFGVHYWSVTNEFEMWIYNRWGQLVFFTKDKMKCWDGKFKGVQQPSGVFVYQIRAKSPCSSESVYKKGTLVLIR